MEQGRREETSKKELGSKIRAKGIKCISSATLVAEGDFVSRGKLFRAQHMAIYIYIFFLSLFLFFFFFCISMTNRRKNVDEHRSRIITIRLKFPRGGGYEREIDLDETRNFFD